MTFVGVMRAVTSFAALAAVSAEHVGFMAVRQKALLEMEQKNAALKTEVAKNAPHMPDESEVLAGEKVVFRSFKEKAESLLRRLAVAEEEGAAAIRDAKAKYDVTLNAQHEQNLAVERKNEEIAQEVTVLHAAIADARSNATELTKTNKGFQAELISLRQNYTTAQEFINNVISDSAPDLAYNTTELQVLRELNQQDTAEKQAREHESKLQGVAMAGSTLSFLQIDASNKLSVDTTMDRLVRHHLESRSRPKEEVYTVEQLVSQLVGTLHDLQASQNASDAQLRSMFEEQYQKAEENHQLLLQTQAQLNATKESASLLKVRVFAARDSLQQTHASLLGQINAVKHFTYQVGAGERVASLQRVGN